MKFRRALAAHHGLDMKRLGIKSMFFNGTFVKPTGGYAKKDAGKRNRAMVVVHADGQGLKGHAITVEYGSYFLTPRLTRPFKEGDTLQTKRGKVMLDTNEGVFRLNKLKEVR